MPRAFTPGVESTDPDARIDLLSERIAITHLKPIQSAS